MLEVATSHLVANWVDHESSPRAVIDLHMHVIWANRAAMTIADGALRIEDGMLKVNARSNQDEILHIAAALVSGSETVIVSSGTIHTIVELTAIGGAQDGAPANGDRHFGVRWSVADETYHVRYAKLEKVYQLTRMELSILLGLANGHTADEIATASAKSLETVRSHIRQIYVKLSVNSREELLFKIQPFRV